jgi:hypothetical protein
MLGVWRGAGGGGLRERGRVRAGAYARAGK